VVVNTCAFIEDARQESVDTILALADHPQGDGARAGGHRLHGRALRRRAGRRPARGRRGEPASGCRSRSAGAADPVPVPGAPSPPSTSTCSTCPGHGPRRRGRTSRSPRGATGLRLLRHPELPGPAAQPDDRVDPRRGRARSGAQEIVLVAQDLASYGKDATRVGASGSIVPLVRAVAGAVDRVRLLYLYPSDLTDELIGGGATGVPYFDLSLQHVSKPLLRRMRRWGDGDRFLERIEGIRARGARGRVPVELHRRLPGRDRGRPRRSCSPSWRPPSSTGAGSSPTRPRTAPTR
jgi:ribosomal protein S12 methylthiotransferase